MAPDDDDAALRRGQAVARLARDVIEVTGPDAESFLQGQLSQDIAGLDPGAMAYSFVLEPTGKVGALLHVTRDRTDGYVIDVDAGHGETVAARLNRFKLRTKVTIEPNDSWIAAVLPLGDAPRQH